MNSDPYIESRLTALGGEAVWGCWRDQASKKERERTHGHGQQCNNYWGELGGWRRKRMWGDKWQGKNTIKKKRKKLKIRKKHFLCSLEDPSESYKIVNMTNSWKCSKTEMKLQN